MTDLELLRAHEPIVRFTEGEHFFPMDAGTYVSACDLIGARRGEEPKVIVAAGELTLERLAADRPEPGQLHFLRFVAEPMNAVEITRWNLRPERPIFHAPGRLARVGLFARLVDAGFTASLLLRGRVPGGTAAAAAQRYARIREQDARMAYLGRVVRRDGWIVLHYLFLSCMNDWRSSFNGANDHEADLEQAFVVLEDVAGGADGAPIPRWFGCAAHEHAGDELRRRWDDPTLTIVGGHPVIFAGAGSHACYFEAGEYVTPVALPALRHTRLALEGLRRVWRDVLRQDDPGDLGARLEATLSVPFVDYARGDGLAVGPGADVEWTPVLIDDDTPWVDGYRGLWGLDTNDRFAGERAPAGPKYTRSGAVRQSWHDPLGFLGLDTVAPPLRLPAVLRDHIAELEASRVTTGAEAAELGERLRRLTAALPPRSATTTRLSEPTAAEASVAQGAMDLAALRSRDALLVDELQRTRAALTRAEAGDAGDPRAHLRHPLRPQPPEDRAYGRVVETWSAVSAGLLLMILLATLYVGALPVWTSSVVALGAYLAIEAAFRRRLLQLALRLTVALAVAGGLVLLWTFLPLVIVLLVAGVAILAIVDNMRELSTGR